MMTLPRATSVDTDAAEADTAADAYVVLDFQDRHRRRLTLTTEDGMSFLLDLPHTQALADGDRLVLTDGRRIRVNAKHEALLHIRAADPHTLMRIAWHLGNRHLAVAMFADRIDILADHVIAQMVQGLGGQVTQGHGVFQPERGAYAHEH
ncbi:MAG: urease accessory protein UreE [Pseudomonadota bacterium]